MKARLLFLAALVLAALGPLAAHATAEEVVEAVEHKASEVATKTAAVVRETARRTSEGITKGVKKTGEAIQRGAHAAGLPASGASAPAAKPK